LTWPALVRMDKQSDERLLTLIALQPQLGGTAQSVVRPRRIGRTGSG